MELVHTDHSFEPEEGFFQLFSDPRSTRLTRVQLREDVVRDKDLEAIRKQVGSLVIACFQENRAAIQQQSVELLPVSAVGLLWALVAGTPAGMGGYRGSTHPQPRQLASYAF